MATTSSSDANMEYQYKDLGSRDEIRILILKPAAAFDNDLHARIVHRKYPVEAEDASGVNYWNAASYTWGTDPPSRILYIDSTFPQDPNGGRRVIRITPNVDAMLRHLRSKQQEHYLWVDAICLNQSNMPEKNQQVRRMEWIYRLALQVLVWLGEDDGTTRIGMKLVEGLAIVSERPDFANDSENTEGIGLALRELLGNQQPHALDRLFQRPWFGRRWILQEVALAREPIVCCGRYQLPWNKFRAGMEVISKTQSGPLFAQTQLMDDQSARAVRTLLKLNRVSGHYLDLLWNFDTSACKEKHDVIYALLGLATNRLPAPQDKEVGSSVSFSIGSDADLERFIEMASSMRRLSEEPLPLYVDYGTPWYLLFTQVAAYFVHRTAFASITRHLYAFGSLHETNSDWPSWVPDWSRPRRPEPKTGMSNVVPWASSVDVVDEALHIYARRLCTTRNVLTVFPATQQDFRETIRRLLQGTDTTPVPTDTNHVDSDNISDLTISEAIVGDLLRSGLDIGLCKPIPAESSVITEAWIVNKLSAHAIARAIFTPEWRAGEGGILDGIMSCLQGASLFVTGALQLGIGPAKMKDGDQIVLIDDYYGLPDLNRQTVEETELQAAAILRPVEEQQEGQSQMKENAKYVLIGPCILARRKNEVITERTHITLV